MNPRDASAATTSVLSPRRAQLWRCAKKSSLPSSQPPFRGLWGPGTCGLTTGKSICSSTLGSCREVQCRVQECRQYNYTNKGKGKGKGKGAMLAAMLP